MPYLYIFCIDYLTVLEVGWDRTHALMALKNTYSTDDWKIGMLLNYVILTTQSHSDLKSILLCHLGLVPATTHS